MKTLDALQQAFIQSEIQHPGLFIAKEVTDNIFSHLCRTIRILDCEEPLLPLPASLSRFDPHPYEALGAPYVAHSPWHLRSSVLERLLLANEELGKRLPGASLRIYDAYRPVAVQEFMVRQECQRQALDVHGQSFDNLPQDKQALVMEEVLEFWAPPSYDVKRPPPHSTGSAVDLTIITADGNELPMGTSIDQIAPESHPFVFLDSKDPEHRQYHENRMLLLHTMEFAGFHRLPSEWWHFSYGDQIWATLESLRLNKAQIAHFGRVELNT